MDILKLFPALFLDLLSKVIPGSILIAAFQAQNLPPPELILETLGLGSKVPVEWQGWYPLVITIMKAYIIGVFIALIANYIDSFLLQKIWYKIAKRNEIDYSFDNLSPPGFSSSLKNKRSFKIYIEHCRIYIFSLNITSSALLEKYRTAYRFFIALTIVFIVLPFGPYSLSWACFLAALVFASISVSLSKKYMEKSIELFMFLKNISQDGEDNK
ncbi:MAG: hypothetical protein ACRCU9_06775 [Iodobacter sp.]